MVFFKQETRSNNVTYYLAFELYTSRSATGQNLSRCVGLEWWSLEWWRL